MCIRDRLRGIQVSDLNQKVSACDDFYEFANGGWRAANPIPDSMPRWSRRWQSGETTKDKLHDILDQVAAIKNAPKGSVEQLTGDFYSSCMDESRANALGIKPLDPMLADIDQIKSREDLEKLIARFHAIAIPVPFGIFGGSDKHEPTDVIATIYASGLSLPDRDYYTKDEQRFQEAREKFTDHVAKMFVLAGYSQEQSSANARAVLK